MGKMRGSSSEEVINAELRELTRRTRELREEITGMINSGPAKDLTKGQAHVPSASAPSLPTQPAPAGSRRRKPV